MRLGSFLVASSLVCSAVLAAPRPPAPEHGSVPRATGGIEIDGRLDEAAWESALVFDVPFEVSPGENATAPVATRCYVTYDGSRLYVAFRADDPRPEQIRAHVADRDSVYRNDYVGIAIDPFHDGRRGFEFMVNPLGVQMDASTSEINGTGNGSASVSGAPAEDFSWDAIWDAAGRVDERGYAVEMAIPFSSLRFPRTSGPQTWGLVAFRAWPRDAMHKLRSVPVDRGRSCYFCLAGTIGGMTGMTPGRNLEFDPTLTFARTDTRGDAGMQKGDGETDLGLSARWGVTPNLSLNAALNPDFSQIEADVVQLSVNRRHALSYPEKRPFFQEGADFFNSPQRIIYSRSIADPAWGAKLTGKEGANGIGLIVARDRVTNLVLPRNDGSRSAVIDAENTSAVLRYRRDVGENSAVGGLVTNRQGDGYHNRVYGLDSFLRPSDQDSISLQVLRSETAYPDDFAGRHRQQRGSFDGTSWRAAYDHNGRDWDWWSHVQAKSRGFRADLGFVAMVDVREADTGLARTWWGDATRWFTRLQVSTDTYVAQDSGGGFLSRSTSLEFAYDGPLQSSFRTWGVSGEERYKGRDFPMNGIGGFFNIRPTGNFTTSLEWDFSDGIDYEHVRPGKRQQLEYGFTYNVGRHLYLQGDHTWERFLVGDAWLYRANVSALRVIYQFNTRFFVRTVLQRERIDLNPALYARQVDPQWSDVSGQYLLSYKLNPQTMVFAGYSENREGVDAIPSQVRDRTLFLKLGYAWVL